MEKGVSAFYKILCGGLKIIRKKYYMKTLTTIQFPHMVGVTDNVDHIMHWTPHLQEILMRHEQQPPHDSLSITCATSEPCDNCQS